MLINRADRIDIPALDNVFGFVAFGSVSVIYIAKVNSEL